MIPKSIQSVLGLAAYMAIPTMMAQGQTIEIPIAQPVSVDWRIAQQVGATKSKLLVVTTDQPDRKQTCRVKSFSTEELVCKRAFGATRTYQPGQVLALILPGDGVAQRNFVLTFLAGSGGAIWASVVLAATCPVCAAGTAAAALVMFSFAGAVGMTDDRPDRLLYLMAGRELSPKLGYIEEP
ncbi:MAG: hypothetical protein KGN79_11155 [Acidobacteriota bacterium]|nr:hypothetical protein [Acidobacteriota bacterium]